MKRVVVISDLHCGHQVGLTPGGSKDPEKEERDASRAKAWLQRRYIWEQYCKWMDALRPISILMCNGDLIDGSGAKTAGRELFEPDLDNQVKMAAEVIQRAHAKKVVITFGTPYHTGQDIDHEKAIAREVDAEKAENVGYYAVNDVIFNVRHYITGSQVPHTRTTAINREGLWNVLWNARKEYPLCDVTVRSHVHYHWYSGNGDWLGMTTPGFQGYGSIYGARHFSGIVDVGLIAFDIPDKGKAYQWTQKLLRMPAITPLSL